MKKKDIIRLYNGLQDVKKIQGNQKYFYGIVINLKKLEPIIEVLKEVQQPSEGYLKYATEHQELLKKHANKDEKGKPVIVNQQYQIDDMETFEKESKKLQKKHEEAIKEHEAKGEEMKTILEEEETIELHKVAFEHFPDMTPEQFENIFEIVEEPKEE